MPVSTDEARSVLYDLSRICKDGEEGFRTASDHAMTPSLKDTFREIAEERARFATEIQTALSDLGGVPSQEGTMAGTLHRGWLGLKTMVGGNHDAEVIAEAERGETIAETHYREAVAKDLPNELHLLLKRQFAAIEQTLAKLRQLNVHAKYA